MPIQKSLQDYLSKMKTPRSPIRLPSKKWILSGCKHPRTPSFGIPGNNNNNKKNDDEASLEDIDRFLFENFKSLYLRDDEETEINNKKNNSNSKRVVSEEETLKKPSNLGPMFFDSSNRFDEFPIDLGGLLMESTNTNDEAGSSSTSTMNDFSGNEGVESTAALPENCVVVLASSPSPYDDFRRSMEGVIQARLKNHERVDWDFMEELLFSYINLNEKKSYKFILSAFVDLITVMRRRSDTPPAKPRSVPRSVRTVRIGREFRKKTKEVTFQFSSP